MPGVSRIGSAESEQQKKEPDRVVQLRMIVALRVDPAQALGFVQIFGDRLGGNEPAVTFDRQTELSAQG